MEFWNFYFQFSITSPKDAELNFRRGPGGIFEIQKCSVLGKLILEVLGGKTPARIATVKWSYNDSLKLWWHQRYWRSTPVVLVHWLIAKFFFCGEHFLVTCFMCVKMGWKGCIKICTQQDAYFWTKVWCDQNKPESCLTHCILADF